MEGVGKSSGGLVVRKFYEANNFAVEKFWLSFANSVCVCCGRRGGILRDDHVCLPPLVGK